MEITKGMIDKQLQPAIDQEKLKQLLAGCFQDVIMSMYCANLGEGDVVRTIDLINNRIERANLVVDTGI